jgi:hypothetical protein
MSLVAYISDVFVVPRQTVSLGAPVTVQLIPPLFRESLLRKSGELEAFNLAGDDAHPKAYVGRLQVKRGLVVGISSSPVEAISLIHLIDDKATTFIYLPSFRVEGSPQQVAEKLGVALI